ncbi:hypothetical protein BDV95DRAFT_603037 [Massariosphaeria phaeospora]|uniref:Uncharacterized protein n=1 Tax=Massariosphaeria phaeospora TaxID=100035 RepID=A0A7C8MHL4_9PLEO|nr:hypothetical protein BDV95DRAFT_603037 [Massariosphaeria phaeospora]
MPPLPTKAKTAEAQLASGLGMVEWDRFMTFTRIEARALLCDNAECAWTSLPADVKRGIERRVNARLAAESISTVADDIFRWRMSRTLSCLKKSDLKASAKAAAASSSTAAVDNQPTTYPYDPVRDV